MMCVDDDSCRSKREYILHNGEVELIASERNHNSGSPSHVVYFLHCISIGSKHTIKADIHQRHS
jgi:hypothetical protein